MTNSTDNPSGNEARPSVRSTTGKRRARGAATDLVQDRLLQLAEQLGPNARLPRMRALCEELGVSPGTLNLALDKLAQQRILIRRERSGVFVAPQLGQRNVCVICSPDFFLQGNLSPFWQLLLQRIESVASEHATTITVSLSHSFPPRLHNEPGLDPSSLPDYLQSEIMAGNFDGILSVGLPHPTTRWIEAQGVPVVAFAGAARFMVTTSRYSLLTLGVQALAEAGCRSIEFWLPGVDYWQSDIERTQSLLRSLAATHGISHWEIVGADTRSPDQSERYQSPQIETGWKYAMSRLSAGRSDRPLPEGILSTDDMITLGVLMALPRLSLDLGRNFQIATYANAGSPVLMGWQESLYRIEYDLGELVELLYETLDLLMDYGSGVDNYIPPLPYDAPEYPEGTILPEKVRLVRPRLIRPAQLLA